MARREGGLKCVYAVVMPCGNIFWSNWCAHSQTWRHQAGAELWFLIDLCFTLHRIGLWALQRRPQNTVCGKNNQFCSVFWMNVPLCGTWLQVFPCSNRDSLPNQEFLSYIYHLKVEVKSRKLRSTLTLITWMQHYTEHYCYSKCLTRSYYFECIFALKYHKINCSEIDSLPFNSLLCLSLIK